MRQGDYKNAAPHVDNLDAAMKYDRWQTQHMQQLAKELSVLDRSLSRYDLDYRDRAALSGKQAQIKKRLIKGRRTLGDKLLLAPPPIGGEWLPKSAVYALVDLIVVVHGRPKGLFMECGNRIHSGMRIIQGCSATVFGLVFA
jgi:MAternally affected uncoordination